jgi:hypothetical protein
VTVAGAARNRDAHSLLVADERAFEIDLELALEDETHATFRSFPITDSSTASTTLGSVGAA